MKIDEYEVVYSANQFVPRIWLKNGGKYIGQLIFKPNGSALPPDTMAGSQVNLYYHLDDFENAVDLLRNESLCIYFTAAPRRADLRMASRQHKRQLAKENIAA
jgi:hypothetical protein